MAISALSADAFGASPTNLPACSIPTLTRRQAMSGAVGAMGAVALTRTPWTTPFDPDAWLERWYRLGNSVGTNERGEPMLWQNMDGDEQAARALCDELEYLGNRVRLRRYLSAFKPARAGMYSVYAGRRA